MDRLATNALGNTDRRLRPSWHPVARSVDVGPSLTPVMVLGEPWIVYRSKEDQNVRAWPDRCPHRLAPLSRGSVTDEGLQCGYHGWTFGHDGLCRSIPALDLGATMPPRARLAAPGGIAERYGLVWLAPDAPLCDLPEIDAEIAGEGIELAELPVIDTRASAGLLADNFLDMAHFPFLHRDTFGADEETLVAPYSVERDGWGFAVSYTHKFANREDPGVSEGLRPLVQTRRMSYRYWAPFSLTLKLEYLDTGAVNTIGFFLQPQTAEQCRIFSMLWRNDIGGDAVRAKEFVDFEMAVVGEDLALQSRYHDLRLPLDPQVEVHTRADRITLELRRVLADLVAAAEKR